MNQDLIRNFSIIAHIDHGKSTLADRILEITRAIPPREMREQYLDRMEIERERGITIKAQAIRLNYKARDGQTYFLNLIDTPGHVDFSYEVSRTLSACEGVLLVVDATQGVEAQTITNAFMALEHNLKIILVINKIDLEIANIERTKEEIEKSIGLEAGNALLVSARTGEGVSELMERIISDIPAPEGNGNSPFKSLIFDSFYDSYRGVITLVRIFDGKIKAGMKVRMMAAEVLTEVEEVGYLSPDLKKSDELSVGEVGYLVTGIKDVHLMRVGDTITSSDNPTNLPLPGYKEVKPMVYSSLYPIDNKNYEDLKEALGKLRLNDASLIFQPESVQALGHGFRCGFLGLLHLTIVKERLEREYSLELMTTIPNVSYEAVKKNGEAVEIKSAYEFPATQEIAEIREPYVRVTIILPAEYVGSIMELCQSKRGEFKNMIYVGINRVQLEYLLPFVEVIVDFYDLLKSYTKGYGSLDYEFSGYQKTDLVKLDLLLNNEPIDALSFLVYKEKAYAKGKEIVQKLRKMIPRQQYEVAIQAAIGKKVIARETVKAKRKDVLAKCYGGDVTRKRKLLEKQKMGKKKMKKIGRIEVPPEVFTAFYKE